MSAADTDTSEDKLAKLSIESTPVAETDAVTNAAPVAPDIAQVQGQEEVKTVGECEVQEVVNPPAPEPAPAAAAPVNATAAAGLGKSEPGADASVLASVDHAIIQALLDKERPTVLMLEEMIEVFLSDTCRDVLEFPRNLTNYQRMLAHRVGQHYGLQTSTVDYETALGRVVGSRTKWAGMKMPKLSQLGHTSLRYLVVPTNTNTNTPNHLPLAAQALATGPHLPKLSQLGATSLRDLVVSTTNQSGGSASLASRGEGPKLSQLGATSLRDLVVSTTNQSGGSASLASRGEGAEGGDRIHSHPKVQRRTNPFPNNQRAYQDAQRMYNSETMYNERKECYIRAERIMGPPGSEGPAPGRAPNSGRGSDASGTSGRGGGASNGGRGRSRRSVQVDRDNNEQALDHMRGQALYGPAAGFDPAYQGVVPQVGMYNVAPCSTELNLPPPRGGMVPVPAMQTMTAMQMSLAMQAMPGGPPIPGGGYPAPVLHGGPKPPYMYPQAAFPQYVSVPVPPGGVHPYAYMPGGVPGQERAAGPGQVQPRGHATWPLRICLPPGGFALGPSNRG
eukprot:gene24670-10298_t